MFNFLKKKAATDGKKITLKIEGMHCTSCAVNIDGEMEELQGVLSSETSYAKMQTVVTYDPEKTSVSDMKKVVIKLGYEVV